MATLITGYNQSIEDLTIQIYGSLDYMSQLMSDNDLSISDYIPINTSITYDSSFVPNTTQYTTGILGNGYCGIITGLTITYVSYSSVIIGWNNIIGASNYIYQINTTGIMPTSFTGTTVNTNSVTLTGLLQNTNYFIYIATNCGSNNYSNWTLGEFVNQYFEITDVYYSTPDYAIGGYVTLE